MLYTKALAGLFCVVSYGSFRALLWAPLLRHAPGEREFSERGERGKLCDAAEYIRCFDVFPDASIFFANCVLLAFVNTYIDVCECEYVFGHEYGYEYDASSFVGQLRALGVCGEVGSWGRDPKKCTGRDWGMGSNTI